MQGQRTLVVRFKKKKITFRRNRNLLGTGRRSYKGVDIFLFLFRVTKDLEGLEQPRCRLTESPSGEGVGVT